MTDDLTYDADSRVIARNVGGHINDAVAYDAANRILRANQNAVNTLQVDTWYGPLGGVVAAVGATQSYYGGAATEKFTVDAIGNRHWTQAQNTKPPGHMDQDGERQYRITSGGALQTVIAPYDPSQPGYSYEKIIGYDLSGNVDVTVVKEAEPGSNTLVEVSKNYYDAGDKLRGFNRALGPYGDDDTHPGNRNVFEEYYYDALGRRVLVRSRRTASCSTEITECGSYVARTVWDGDQVVFEIRTPGGTGTASTTMESDNGVYSGYDGNKYGQTAYVHAGGIDQPVVVMRMGYNGSSTPISVHPHQNWRGSFELGTKSDGTLMTITSGSPVIAWAGARTTLDGEIAQPADGPIWFGGLIPGKTDGSGLQYMRNRYYDPKTGRFTQQDPIGLAGGMNLYGFASGDPVNFSDPFGLCPMELTGRPCLGPMDGPLTLRSDGNPRVGQFGMVRDGGQRAHQGVDIHGLRGQAVLAADEGVVARTGYDEGGFGHFVQLAHKNGSGDVVSYTLYGHLGQASGLKQGASVKAGGVIGAIGRSGNLTTEPTHLHFEIRTRLLAGPGTGNRLDPAKYLPITP